MIPGASPVAGLGTQGPLTPGMDSTWAKDQGKHRSLRKDENVLTCGIYGVGCCPKCFIFRDS